MPASDDTHDVVDEPNLATMPEEVLLRLITYVDDNYAHRDILSLERTCLAFWRLLQDDKIWEMIASNDGSAGDEYEYPPTIRERVFLRMTIDNIRIYQGDASTENLLLKFLGGVDGMRCLLDKLVDVMGLPCRTFRAIRCDAIEYIAEIVQCNVMFNLFKILRVQHFSGRPGDSYPTVKTRDFTQLDGFFRTDYSDIRLDCCIACGLHNCRLTDLWTSPDEDSKRFLGEEEQRQLVRALAYRAGIVKMSGEVFSIVSTQIVHDVAVLVHRVIIMNWDYGLLSLLVTPHHIEDAAKHLGMRPILFGFGYDDDEWDEEGNRLYAMKDDDDESYVQNDSDSESSDKFE